MELVHNFSLLHDDLMDRDTERRHRPTGWVVFGEGQAILAGNAMLTRAVEVLLETGSAGLRSLPCLLDSTQLLISGQSRDLALEGRTARHPRRGHRHGGGQDRDCWPAPPSMGALAAGAADDVVKGLETFGYELGIAFQLVDDVLGVVGDPARTGKSSSSDVRAGKRSSVVVAALADTGSAGARLNDLLAKGAPSSKRTSRWPPRSSSRPARLIGPTVGPDAHVQKAIAVPNRSDWPSLRLAGELAASRTYIVNRDR